MRSELFFAIATLAGVSLAGDAAYWRPQAIYQIMTDRFARTDNSTSATCDTSNNDYCGGTWRGILNQLDYIQGMGFTAIWISPITYQLQGTTKEGSAYHGYWQQDLYRLNDAFGTEADLKALVAGVHARNMSFMIDTIPNHMAWSGDASSVDYSKFNPINKQSQYHTFCDLNSEIATAGNNNATQILETCWLGDSTVELADLRTEDSDVANTLYSWIGQTVSNYSIDGLRIDAAKHIAPEFFPGFMKSAGVFGMGEVLDGNAAGACEWQKDSIGSVLNYPIYYPIRRAFGATNGSMSDIVENLQSVNSDCQDPTVLGSFSESHDLDRFPTLTDDETLAQNMYTYSFMTDGIPIIYQGQEQHLSGKSSDNSNREAIWTTGYNVNSFLYKHIAALNNIRTHAIGMNSTWTTSGAQVAYQDQHVLAMAKGPSSSRTMIVVNNNGADGSAYTVSMPLDASKSYAANTNLTEILTCNTATVGSDGKLNVPISKGAPNIYFPTANLKGSGLCGTTKTTTPSTSASSGAASSSTSASKNGAARARVGKVGVVLVAVAVGFMLL